MVKLKKKHCVNNRLQTPCGRQKDKQEGNTHCTDICFTISTALATALWCWLRQQSQTRVDILTTLHVSVISNDTAIFSLQSHTGYHATFV